MGKKAVVFGTVVATSALALGVGASAAGASTATPPTLSSVQAKAAAAITLRVNDLNAAIVKVNSAKNLGAEAARLDAYLQQDIAPLQSLGQQIAADTSLPTAEAQALTIYTNFRVLALVLPAARLVTDASKIVNSAIPTLEASSTKVSAKVTPANQSELEPLIDNLNAYTTAASDSTSSAANTVLSYTPAQWNANEALLSTERSQIASAVPDINNALHDLAQIRADLKSGKAAAPAATPTTPTTAS
jgi:hypothetical protein